MDELMAGENFLTHNPQALSPDMEKLRKLKLLQALKEAKEVFERKIDEAVREFETSQKMEVCKSELGSFSQPLNRTPISTHRHSSQKKGPEIYSSMQERPKYATEVGFKNKIKNFRRIEQIEQKLDKVKKQDIDKKGLDKFSKSELFHGYDWPKKPRKKAPRLLKRFGGEYGARSELQALNPLRVIENRRPVEEKGFQRDLSQYLLGQVQREAKNGGLGRL